jgi:hypothetical protein
MAARKRKQQEVTASSPNKKLLGGFKSCLCLTLSDSPNSTNIFWSVERTSRKQTSLPAK